MKEATGRTIFVSFCLAVLLLLPGLAVAADESSSDPVIAVFDGGVIFKSEIASWRLLKTPTKSRDDTLAIATKIALAKTLAAEARELGLDKDPALKTAEENAATKTLIDALRSTVKDGIVVSPAEIQATYEKQKATFTRPRKIHLNNLYRKLPEGASEEQRQHLGEEVEGYLEALKAGADFSDLARKHSDSQTRFRGGVLGLVDPTELRPEAGEAVAMLGPGDLSRIVETSDGFTIFRCNYVREAFTRSFEEVAANIEKHIHEWKMKRRWKELAETFTTNEQLANLARELGVDRQPEVAARLVWEPLNLLAGAALSVRVEKRFEPATDDEIAAGVTKLRKGVDHNPVELDLSVIELEVIDASALHERTVVAESLRTALENGELSFSEAARAHSNHPSAAIGGALGWRTLHQIWSTIGPAAAEALRPMNAGELSPVIQEGLSLWTVKINGRREIPTAEMEERVRRRLQKHSQRRLAVTIEKELSKTLQPRVLPTPR